MVKYDLLSSIKKIEITFRVFGDILADGELCFTVFIVFNYKLTLTKHPNYVKAVTESLRHVHHDDNRGYMSHDDRDNGHAPILCSDDNCVRLSTLAHKRKRILLTN